MEIFFFPYQTLKRLYHKVLRRVKHLCSWKFQILLFTFLKQWTINSFLWKDKGTVKQWIFALHQFRTQNNSEGKNNSGDQHLICFIGGKIITYNSGDNSGTGCGTATMRLTVVDDLPKVQFVKFWSPNPQDLLVLFVLF